MKVILSRKGFDSEFGGHPSPILPNGQMISLPIPNQDERIRYSEIVAGASTYYDLIKELMGVIKLGNDQMGIDEDTRCHLDPDLYRKTIFREHNWKPLFGQINAAQGHLRKQNVSENDLFLFFGSFRRTSYNNCRIVFNSHEKEIHAIFGYLQIGDIIKADQQFDAPNWMMSHPHINAMRREKKTNTIYISRDSLSWNESLPGAGRFIFNDKLVLTKKGHSKSKWDLPDCFRNAEISYHKHPWKDGYFQSAGKGQEFVIKDNRLIEEWARNIIEESKIDY